MVDCLVNDGLWDPYGDHHMGNSKASKASKASNSKASKASKASMIGSGTPMTTTIWVILT